ncbi:MAG: helix-turn-helix transcriptional regulator [Acidobacteria bacterium]|nr:helix-turn-helix transcriptional regulator [Acidobacteriota bacterium]
MRIRYRPLPAREEFALASAASPSFHFGEAFYPSRLHVDDHAHKNHSVTFVLQGSLTETYARTRAERCPPVTALFRPAGEPRWDVMGESGSLNLEVELIDHAVLSFGRLGPLFERPIRSWHPRISGIAQQIHVELGIGDSAQSTVLEGLTLELLGIATRAAGSSRRSASPMWLNKVFEVLNDRFREPVRISELATVAGVHPVHLARVFRAHYGVTPGLYMRRLRLRWAARRLTATNAPLGEIAAEAGFSDQSHFGRLFKQYFGIPPGRIRTH